MLNIFFIDDILNNILNYLDYFSFLSLKKICYESYKINNNYYITKIRPILNFIYKNKYEKFYDLKHLKRKGYLINLKLILNNPFKYLNKRIQCISWLQYNFSYLPKGYIIEGFIHFIDGAWILYDIDSKKIHPLTNPFIFPKSLRIIN